MTFNIPDPRKQFTANLENSQTKYRFGEKGNKLSEVKKAKPVFAFDYLSLSKGDFCFNSKLLNPQRDYIRLLESLKKISDKTYDDLSSDNTFHFHDVKFSDTHVTESEFMKCLTNDKKHDIDDLPTVYQFKVFEEARVFGFIYKCVFYLVWFDRKHKVYKRK